MPVHPGFAGSDIPSHVDTVEDLAYLYLDLLNVLDLHDVIVMGCDMGGWLAAEMAIRTTMRLSKLLLVDAVGIKVGAREQRDIADIFALPDTEVARLLFYDPTRRPDPTGLTEAELEHLAGNRMAYAMYTWNPYMHHPKLRYRLHRINVPTRLIWGAHDGMVSTTYAEAYRALIPEADLVIIAEAGHFPQVEQPERFLEAVFSFVTG